MKGGPTRAGFFTDKGPYRPRNEDVAFSSPDSGIFIVADGLGGAAAGDRAARIATDILYSALQEQGPAGVAVDTLLPEGETRAVLKAMAATELELGDQTARLRFAYLVAHCGVLAEGRNTGCVGMATAMVTAWFNGGRCMIAHVGDCRAYAWTAGSLSLLTRDHSLSVALAGRSCLPEGAENSPFLRSRLTQVVGGETAPTPDVQEWDPEQGSGLLLCSDGVWGSLADERMLEILSQEIPPEEISRQLVETAIEQGSRDNATALVIFL
jgi:protein phosphatase